MAGLFLHLHNYGFVTDREENYTCSTSKYTSCVLSLSLLFLLSACFSGAAMFQEKPGAQHQQQLMHLFAFCGRSVGRVP